MADPDRLGGDEDPPPASLPPSEGPVTVGYTRVSAHRIAQVRHSSSPPPSDEDLLRLVADLLLAAACVDGETSRRERHSLRKIQARLSGGTVPEWLNRHIAAFDLDTFDLEATTGRLRSLPTDQRRYVAELVREICEANNVIDLEEERFLLSVIFALALEPHVLLLDDGHRAGGLSVNHRTACKSVTTGAQGD